MKVIFSTSKEELSGTVSHDGIRSLAEYVNDLLRLAAAQELKEDELLPKLHQKLQDLTIHATEDEKEA